MRCKCCNELSTTLWKEEWYCKECKDAILTVLQEEYREEHQEDHPEDFFSLEEAVDLMLDLPEEE